MVRELTEERDPTLVHLCTEHTDRLTPPIGWRIRDTRIRIPAGT